MGYLKCKSCGGHYDLQPGELPGDFENCHCGGELEFYDDRGNKRGYTPAYSGKRNGSKLHPLIKILIIIVGGYLVFIFLGRAFVLVGYGLEYFGPSGGTYIFGIFFGICIASILAGLWFIFRRK